MSRVTIVDYGLGNMLSVARAFENIGAQVTLAKTGEEIAAADRLVLPGVGAFADAMDGLRQTNLIDPVKQYAKSGNPFLGICVGMQMLFDSAEEFGHHEGLGLIPGQVEAIPSVDIHGAPQKIPHIGWTDLEPLNSQRDSWSNTILQNVKPGQAAYFVHSFMVVPKNESHRLADAFYGGQKISAVVKSENILGCQFHPEKSGPVGLAILKAFLNL